MANVKHIYLLRHGETEQNKQGIVQGRGINSSLNETGLIQARAFYDHYKNKVHFDLLLSSSLDRSFQTIQLFETNSLKIIRDSRIDEISWGEHEGKAGEPEYLEKYYKVINAWTNGDYHAKAHKAESAHELALRLEDFIQDLILRPFDYALICTHGRTLRALICILKNWPLAYMDNVIHNNTGLYKVTYDQASWKVLVDNHLVHLENLK